MFKDYKLLRANSHQTRWSCVKFQVRCWKSYIKNLPFSLRMWWFWKTRTLKQLEEINKFIKDHSELFGVND